MIVTWYDSGVPAVFGGNITHGFAFCDPAQIEEPAPIKYHIAQKFKHMIQKQLGPDFRWQVSVRAHQVWLIKRPWFCSFV